MSIPYRTRQGLKRFVIGLLIVALVAVVVWACWLLWLSRYVVYTRDGAMIDMGKSSHEIAGELAVPPSNEGAIEVYYNEGDDVVQTDLSLTRLNGYYITAQDLKGDLSELRTQIRNLPAGTAVMIEVKNSFGSFFYNSTASEFRTDTLDVDAVDSFIRFLNQQDLYTIARLPALRDYSFGLNNTWCGLPHPAGYLWADDDYRYWLNPTSEGTITYLASIASELKDMGFDEVVYFDFRFPDTQNIVFNGDKQEALAKAAKTLVTTCATDNFAVSFEGSEGFSAPEGRSRIFMEGVDGFDAEAVATASGIEDTEVYLAFVTETYDTRFDAYGVMRPIAGAH